MKIIFEHFFEPLIGQQTFLRSYLIAQKSCVTFLSAFLSLSSFFWCFFSTQKKTQGTSEPLWVLGPTSQEIPQQERLGMGFEDYHNLTMVLEVIVLVL